MPETPPPSTSPKPRRQFGPLGWLALASLISLLLIPVSFWLAR